LDGGLPNYNVYRTKDNRQVALGALEPHFWKKFCAHMKLPTREAQFSLPSHKEVQKLFVSKTLQEWCEIASEIDVCLEPVLTAGEVPSHVQHVARRVVLHSDGALEGGGERRQLVLGPRFSSSSTAEGEHPRLLPPAAAVGEHSRELLSEAGFSEDEVSELLLRNVAFVS
jgi:alpha-methylacyl-CoA racemase